jgi:hypothetical protein
VKRVRRQERLKIIYFEGRRGIVNNSRQCECTASIPNLEASPTAFTFNQREMLRLPTVRLARQSIK